MLHGLEFQDLHLIIIIKKEKVIDVVSVLLFKAWHF